MKQDPDFSNPSGIGTNYKRRHPDSRVFLGIGLIAVGSLLIARNFGWLDEEITHYLISWQALLIGLGIFNLYRKAYTAGLVLISIGVFFWVDLPDDIRHNLWPAILIIIGLSAVLQWRKSPNRFNHDDLFGQEKSTIDYIDETAIFGGRNVSVVSDNFKGGKITSIFGGSKINMLNAKPAQGCVIDIANIFGGTKMIVPEDWNVKIEVVSIFGGFEDKRGLSVIARSNTDKIVIIKGSCIFGGGEINTMP